MGNGQATIKKSGFRVFTWADRVVDSKGNVSYWISVYRVDADVDPAKAGENATFEMQRARVK